MLCQYNKEFPGRVASNSLVPYSKTNCRAKGSGDGSSPQKEKGVGKLKSSRTHLNHMVVVPCRRPGNTFSRLSHNLGVQLLDCLMVSAAVSTPWESSLGDCLADWASWASNCSTVSWFLLPCRRRGNQLLRLPRNLGAFVGQLLDCRMVSAAVSAPWESACATVSQVGRPGRQMLRLLHARLSSI